MLFNGRINYKYFEVIFLKNVCDAHLHRKVFSKFYHGFQNRYRIFKQVHMVRGLQPLCLFIIKHKS